ncbi:hypothetical protein BT93_C0725 [Corymbia citriodora subsp. variegata]|nr:hypothetical protein BT93_C0725 [Corymbia citriodora subsp. variegata]
MSSTAQCLNSLLQNHRALPASQFLFRPSVIDYSTFINFIVRKQVINLRAPTKITSYLCYLLPAPFSMHDIFYFTANRWQVLTHGQLCD